MELCSDKDQGLLGHASRQAGREHRQGTESSEGDVFIMKEFTGHLKSAKKEL